MRLACVLVPDFPLQALRRSAPDLAEAPLAVACGPSPRDVVVAVSAEAAAFGVRPGMTSAQARQAFSGVLVRVAPQEVTAAAAEALADVAGSFSPRIRRRRPGEVLVDVGGLVPRFGSEARVAHELLRGCRRVGLEGCVGVASGTGVARTAARTVAMRTADGFPAAGSWAVVPDGGERTFLAALPVALLDAAPELTVRLMSWGIHRAAEVAALPREDVALRLGREGVALHRLACGEADGGFIPDPVCEVLREGVLLEDPVVALEAFLFVLRGILARLARRLELRSEGFAEVLLDLSLEGGEHHEVRVRLVAPTREVPAVLALARLELEAGPPGAPVEGVVALVTPGRVRLVQGSLFGARMPAPAKLAMTLARLAALVEPGRVGAPAVPDTHHPGSWTMGAFAPVPVEGGEGVAGSRPPVLRTFRPPRLADVVMSGGRPVSVLVDGLGGSVVGWAGPYRFVGEWWSEQPWARDDFDVATADGTLLRVCFDRLEHRWYAEGVYD